MNRISMNLVYLKMELKRAKKRILSLYAGVALLLLLSAVIVLLASRVLYGDAVVGRVPVGVSMPEDDPLARQVVRMLSTLDSVKSVCDFEYMNREAGLEALEKGELYAVLDVPENFVQGIMNGDNIPVTVWMAKDMRIEGKIFQELADAGALTLSAGQAGIYAGNELYRIYGLDEWIARLELDLNNQYMDYGLRRSVYFRHRKVEATGDVSVVQFYEISIYVLFLFMTAIPVSGYLIPWKKTMVWKLKSAGVGIGSQIGARIAGMTVLLLLGSLPIILILTLTGQIPWNEMMAVVWLLSCTAAASMVVLLFQLAGNLLGGIMLLFFVMTGQHFLAGGVLPLVFLPPSLQKLAPWLPSSVLMDSMKMAVSGTWDYRKLAACIILIWVSWLVSVMAERKRR